MLRVTAFFALLAGVVAFVPPAMAPARRHRAAPAVSMISNPFNREPPKPKKPWGDENPYRIFGVNEEAPYEEVERAFKELVEENEGNEKYIMQLEMMKEDIFDQRLRARMSGALKSKIKESPFDAKLQVRKVPWIERIDVFKRFDIKLVAPERTFSLQVSGLFLAFIALGIASAQLAPTMIAFGFLASVGVIYNRGTPKVAGPELRGGGGGGSYSAFGKAVALSMLATGIAILLANSLMASVALPRAIAGDALVATFVNVFLGGAANFFQVQCLE